MSSAAEPMHDMQATLRDVANAHRPVEWGRWLLWAFVLAVSANFAWIVAWNPNFGWPS